MKRLFKTNFLLIFFGLNLLTACGDDPDPINISTNNFTTSIAENPENGDVIGILDASVNRGDISYAILSENPAGAMEVNETTGQLLVKDKTLFDFETRTSVSAMFEVTVEGVTQTGSITVNITDVVEVSVIANDLNTTIAENPSQGMILLTPNATVTGVEGKVFIGYSIISQEPANALIIDGESQRVEVNNASLFNYELRTSITATYKATAEGVSDTATITITLTDVLETVQQRLDDGETPSQIVESGMAVDSIYGKIYQGGAIVNYTNSGENIGNCLIMYPEKISTNKTQSQANTLVQNLSANGKNDWRLPSDAERSLFCANIRADNQENLPQLLDEYWTSTNCGGICFKTFFLQVGSCSNGGSPSSNQINVLAVRNSF